VLRVASRLVPSPHVHSSALRQGGSPSAGQADYGTRTPFRAAGFLFLGAGNSTFGTANADIAALLIALYPQLPLHTCDNSCHLQVRGRAYGVG